jgi:Arc/MetJ-type ribon-helix-helix transcriptional regulator
MGLMAGFFKTKTKNTWNKMKHKLSVSIDMNTVLKMFEKIRDGTFRNRSHLVEFAVQKYLKEEGLKV